MTNPLAMKINHMLDAVAEFGEAFDASPEPSLWIKLVAEETQECLDAIAANDKLNGLKEAADLAYVTSGLTLVLTVCREGDLSEREVAELKYVTANAFSAATEIREHFGFTSEQVMEAFDRVHASNMSKLDDDGKPIRREDGKILKGPNYKAPDLTDLV